MVEEEEVTSVSEDNWDASDVTATCEFLSGVLPKFGFAQLMNRQVDCNISVSLGFPKVCPTKTNSGYLIYGGIHWLKRNESNSQPAVHGNLVKETSGLPRSKVGHAAKGERR